MRFELVYKKNNKYKEKYSISRNNIEEAIRYFRDNLPNDNKEYSIRIIKPVAYYYDLEGNEKNIIR